MNPAGSGNAKSWFKENQAVILFLLGQLLLLGVYLVRLESRVGKLETRETTNTLRTDRIVNVLTKNLHLPSPDREP